MRKLNVPVLVFLTVSMLNIVSALSLNAGDKSSFVPNYCQYLWTEQSIDFTRIALELRYKELQKNPPANIPEKIQKYFIWSLIDDAIAENLSVRTNQAIWLKNTFEQHMEAESTHPSNLNTPLMERVENQIRLAAAPGHKNTPFESMGDFNNFLRSYYKTGWITNHDKLSIVVTILQQLRRWNLGRLQYAKSMIDKLISTERKNIDEDLQFEVMNQISSSLMQKSDKRRQSLLIELDILNFTTLGFMPDSYLDSEINLRTRNRLIHYEFELLEAHANDKGIPKGFREEILAHIYFLRLHLLNIDPTGHLVNLNLKELKQP